MENTIDNKAKFFAQYWKQYVLKFKDYKTSYPINGLMENNIEDVYLELTPLSSITDEDAIGVCKLISVGSFYTQKRWDVSHVENGDASYVAITSKRSHHRFEIDYDGILHVKDEKTLYVPEMVLPDYLAAFQYLISKGYALPYIGIEVETLIEWGWIKLKE